MAIYNYKALFKARFKQAIDSQKLNIKQIEQQLRRMNVNPDDPILMANIHRVSSRFLNTIDKKEGSPHVSHGDKKSHKARSPLRTTGVAVCVIYQDFTSRFQEDIMAFATLCSLYCL